MLSMLTPLLTLKSVTISVTSARIQIFNSPIRGDKYSLCLQKKLIKTSLKLSQCDIKGLSDTEIVRNATTLLHHARNDLPATIYWSKIPVGINPYFDCCLTLPAINPGNCWVGFFSNDVVMNRVVEREQGGWRESQNDFWLLSQKNFQKCLNRNSLSIDFSDGQIRKLLNFHFI